MYDVAEGMGRMEAMMVALSDKVDALDHRLLGNGQPGELAKIEIRIDHLGHRIKVLEKFKWVMSGAGLVFGALGAFAGAIAEAFMKAR